MAAREMAIQVGVRMSHAESEFLGEASRRCEVSKSEVLRSLLPPQELRPLLLDRCGVGRSGRQLGDQVAELVAGGCCWAMLLDGVERAVLEQMSPDGVLEYYGRWRQATHAAAFGIENPPYRLEAPPPGGEWERLGQMGRQVVGRRERLSRDGVEFLRAVEGIE